MYLKYAAFVYQGQSERFENAGLILLNREIDVVELEGMWFSSVRRPGSILNQQELSPSHGNGAG